MPIKRVQFPDGSIHRVEVPEGATNEQIIEFVSSQQPQEASRPDFSQVSGAALTVPSQQAPGPQAAPPQEHGYMSQRLAELKALGQGARFNIAETALGVGQLVGAADEQDVATFRDKRAQAMAEARAGSPRGEGFFGGGEFLGGAAQTAAPMLRAGRAKGVAGLLGSTGAGATYGATRPVADGESRFGNTMLGTVAGLGGHAIGSGLAAAGQVASNATRNAFKAAEARGIPLTAAQVSDSEFVKRFAHLSDRLPFSGATKRQAEQVKSVNKAVAKEFGAKVNEDGVIDANVMADRYARFNDQFDKVFDAGMPLDRDFMASVGSAWKMAGEGMDDAAQRTVETVVRRLDEQAANGQLSGATLKSLDQFLRKAATGGGDRQQVAQELRDALHDAFGRNAPKGAREAWDRVRKEYAIYKRLEPVMADNTEGPLPPTRLAGAMTSDKRGKARMARNAAGEMGDLAAIGRRLRGPQTSGSPEGVQTAAVGYGLMANPASTLALLLSGNTAGRAVNSNALARLLIDERRGKIAPLAPYARPLPLMLSGSAYADEPERP